MKPVFASLFSGGGLADIGALQAGCELAWGVELDERIADIARSNLQHEVLTANILDCDPMKFEKPDILWASPPCVNFSAAKTNGKETELDRQLSQKIVDFIKTLLPAPVQWMGWYEAIEDLIPSLPETKFADWQLKRLGELAATSLIDVGHTIRDCTVRGAIEPAITITAEKMRRPASTPRAFLVESKYPGRNGPLHRADDYPAPTCTAMDQGWKALLIDGQNSRTPEKGGITFRADDEPVFTISSSASDRRAFIVSDQRSSSDQGIGIAQADEPVFTITTKPGVKAGRAWLDRGKVVSMTARALGRFQTLPNWYELPENNPLACRIIGNGAPCDFAEEIIRSTSA